MLNPYGRWLFPYLFSSGRRRPPHPEESLEVLLCFADHFEPRAGLASKQQGMDRVGRWVEDFPGRFGDFRDSDGRTPRWSFFFPSEEYEPEYLDALAGLCRRGFGEVEIHLHHDQDTAEGLRRNLTAFRDLLDGRHGLLSKRRDDGRTSYAFIHGNWALCNSRPDGRWCGVNEEIPILLETGCMADMTFPSAPDRTQPPLTNRIYWAVDRPGRPCSHFTGREIGTVPPPEDGLLILPGPLALNWRSRKLGIFPRVENSCLQSTQPATARRLDDWLRVRIHVPSRPNWIFLKLHAHGAPEKDHDALLGEPMVRFHEELARRAATNPRFRFHYVTAREMVNLALAAAAGLPGTVAECRDYLYLSNLAVAEGDPNSGSSMKLQ